MRERFPGNRHVTAVFMDLFIYCAKPYGIMIHAACAMRTQYHLGPESRPYCTEMSVPVVWSCNQSVFETGS